MTQVNEVEEAEANYFAMCILMPRHMVEKAVRDMGGVDLDDDRPGSGLAALAKMFQVSRSLMAARVAQLRYARN